jgi:hypothetical protein
MIGRSTRASVRLRAPTTGTTSSPRSARPGASAVIVDTQLAPAAGEGAYANTISYWAEKTEPISQGAQEAVPGAG